MATSRTTAPSGQNDGDLIPLTELLRELGAAQSLESDRELAYRLQLQEAINASLASVPSSSASPPHPPPFVHENDAVSVSLPALQSQEIARLQQEIDDRRQSLLETRRIREDLDRRIHDQRVVGEILRIPDREWRAWGDHFEKPFGEGTSRGAAAADEDEENGGDIFHLYFKGLVSEERGSSGGNANLAGIGVAICDGRDDLILEIRKPLIGNGLSRRAAEAKALIEGLNAALSLQLTRISIYCHYHPLYQFIIGRWPPKQHKIAILVNQVSLMQRKFTFCNIKFVARSDIKYAFKLARDAIFSQLTRPAESGHGKTLSETCVICLEDTNVERMFSVDGCRHRYCFSCMKQHVEVKLLHGVVPKCPHEDCKSELSIDSCRKFLTAKLIETLNQRIKEASIPVTEKIYCPYPKCSALMSKSEVSEYAKIALVGAERSGARKCLHCHGLFCVNCKVPWHSNMTCYDYKRLNPIPPMEDVKLKTLASMNLWRQCVKCNHMIELAEGCYHMTCRCGCEFCYNCGAEWKNKKATCSCPLWDEDNIWHGNREPEEDDEEDEVDEYDEYYDSDTDYF